MSDADLNPYAAPFASLVPEPATSDGGVWRDADLLVVRKGSVLPARCVKCNEAAERWKKQTLYWHHPGLYVLLLSPLIYLIVVLIVRQSIALPIGVCRRHLARRRRVIFVAWLLVFGGLGTMILTGSLVGAARRDFALPVLLSGIAMMIVGAFYGVLGARLLWPKRIDPYFAWINGASPEYLAELPEVPPPSIPTFLPR